MTPTFSLAFWRESFAKKLHRRSYFKYFSSPDGKRRLNKFSSVSLSSRVRFRRKDELKAFLGTLFIYYWYKMPFLHLLWRESAQLLLNRVLEALVEDRVEDGVGHAGAQSDQEAEGVADEGVGVALREDVSVIFRVDVNVNVKSKNRFESSVEGK